MKRIALLLLCLCACACSTFGQMVVNVKSGSNKWGYFGPFLGVTQPWNGSAVTVETSVQLPEKGTPGAFPRESWIGILLQDNAHNHRYCLGAFNPTWDPAPAAIPLGVTRHEKNGNWNPVVLDGITLPLGAKQARFRVQFTPSPAAGQASQLIFSFSTDGTRWQEAWKYEAPGDFTPDVLGLSADSFHDTESFGPVGFTSFKVTGKGPAVSDPFDGTVSEQTWQIQEANRGEVLTPVRFQATIRPNDSTFVFERGKPAEVIADLRSNLLLGKTISVLGRITTPDGKAIKTLTQPVTFTQPTATITFQLPAEGLAKNGVYRLVIEGKQGEQILPGAMAQYAVVEPRPVPTAIDTTSPYMYCWPPSVIAAQRLGAVWLRASWYGWDIPRNPDGTYNFSKLDVWMNDAKGKGLSHMGPICASGFANQTPEAIEQYIKDHVDMILQAKERYGDMLRMIEIGNEPENWPVNPVENEWFLMARAQAEITRRVHAKYPDLKVMSTGVTHINLGFLGQLAAVGGPDAADVIAVHGYRTPSAPEYSHEQDVAAIKSLFPNKPLWCNEQAYFSVSQSQNGTPSFDNTKGYMPLNLDEMTHAAYLPRLLLSQLAAGYDGVNWFGGAGGAESAFDSNTYVRPAACTYAALTHILPHPKFVRRLTPMTDDIWALQFTSDGRTVTAIWALDGHWQLRLPADAVQEVQDAFGNPVDPRRAGMDVELVIGQAPQYVVGSLTAIGARTAANPSLPSPGPLVAVEQEQLQPVVLHIDGLATSMTDSRVRVRVKNTTDKPVSGTLALRFNEAACDTPWPSAWKLVPVVKDTFALKAGEETAIDYRIVSSDPAIPFNPYAPGPGFYAKWWATGYHFAARATLADGTKVDKVSDKGLSFRGAPKLDALTVDGEMLEWGGAPLYNQLGDLTRNIGLLQYWFGAADYKPVFRFAWTQEGLAFVALVEDDIQHQPYTGASTWRCDSVDVAIDAHPDDPRTNDFGLFTLALTAKGPEIYRRHATPQYAEGPVTAAKVAAKRVKPSYARSGVTVYEALIPWSELKPCTGQANARLGISVQFNESDGWERMGWEGWFIPMGGQIVDPARFGDLTLIDAGN